MRHARFPIPPFAVHAASVAALGVALLVAGCSGDPGGGAGADMAHAPAPGQIRPKLRPKLWPDPGPGNPAVPVAGAVTAEAFDTTTEAERAAATAGPTGAGAALGRTVATLGNPADPGFWLETPLVDRVRPGRAVAAANGKAVQLELRPIDGAPGAGSRISLAALRLLGVGLTGLHELEVFGR